MGNSWPGAREEPGRQTSHGAGDTEAALAILKTSRGSQWTEEMEALVEYHLRSTWPGPHPKETQHQWATRLCAIYDDQEPAMRKWLDRRLRALETQGEERRNQAQGGPGEPPRSADGKEPESDPGQPQGSHGEQWAQGRGWSRTWGSEWDGSAENPNRADYHHADARLGKPLGMEHGPHARRPVACERRPGAPEDARRGGRRSTQRPMGSLHQPPAAPGAAGAAADGGEPPA